MTWKGELMDAGRPRTVAEPPRCRARQLDQPRAPLDDDDLGQWSGVLLSSDIEGAQARNEEIRIPSPVWMMRSDEIPAAAPDFASLSVHSVPSVSIGVVCFRARFA